MRLTDPLTSLLVFTVGLFAVLLGFALWGALNSKGARVAQLKENLVMVFALIRSYLVYLIVIALIALVFNFLVR